MDLTPRQEMAAKLGWITGELCREGHRLWRALDTLGDEILDEFERFCDDPNGIGPHVTNAVFWRDCQTCHDVAVARPTDPA